MFAIPQYDFNRRQIGLVMVFLSLSVLFVFASRFAFRRPPKGTRPLPGPNGVPLLGNLPAIPSKHSWLQFKFWADHFGPIYRLKLGSRYHVVLSSEAVANELLRERGNYYSSREQTPMSAELLSDNLRPLLLPYNDRWRRGRKLMHRLTMPAAAAAYEPAQSHESKRLLYNLLTDPTHYEKHFSMYAGGLIFRIGYGEAIVTGEEPKLTRTITVNHHLERIVSPGAYLVDSIPALKYLPSAIAPFKQEATRLHAEELSHFRELVEDVRQDMKGGKARPCFALTFIEEQEKFNLSDDEGAYVLGTLFEAGSGTTAAAMLNYCLTMTLFPEWQKPMWEELDRVCGDRIPEFDDIPKLPIVRATIKEVMRWRPVTAGGVPHQLTRDDVYDGYFLPAGAIIHANQWAIHREPDLYPDPESFNPNRWLSPDYPTYKEPLTKFPSLQNFSCFGFGRRICPGMHIAERSLYILTARIAWACRISKKKDENGRDIEVPFYDYTSGFNTQPNPWAFELKPRSEERSTVVAQAWEEARRNDPYGSG